jgi:hypothetical protein
LSSRLCHGSSSKWTTIEGNHRAFRASSRSEKLVSDTSQAGSADTGRNEGDKVQCFSQQNLLQRHVAALRPSESSASVPGQRTVSPNRPWFGYQSKEGCFPVMGRVAAAVGIAKFRGATGRFCGPPDNHRACGRCTFRDVSPLLLALLRLPVTIQYASLIGPRNAAKR